MNRKNTMDVIDAAHRTVHSSSHGGSAALATRLGMSVTILNNKVNPNAPAHHLRLDEAVTIMEFTNDHSIIKAMAHRLGGVYSQVDSNETQASLLMTALSSSACQGDVMSEMMLALADGRISCNERDALQPRIQAAMAMLQTLSKLVDKHCDERLPTN